MDIKSYMTDYLEWYFFQHYERMKLTVEMLEKVVKVDDEILDLGSIFPFSTYWFALYKNAKIICADLCPVTWKLSDSLYSTTVDLNEMMLTDNGKGWKIINFQEVIEHLTCDLTQVRDRVMDVLQPGGYLLAGYPIVNLTMEQGMPPGSKIELHHEIHGQSERPSFAATLPRSQAPCTHQREFFLEECESFFPLKRICSKTVFTLGYTRGTVLVLYRKE